MRHRISRSAALVVLLLLTPWTGSSANSKNQGTYALQGQAGSFLTVDDSRIYYEECGAGPSIVLLHDGLLSSVTWDGEWDALCKKFHVIRYDRRGYGRSDKPTKPFLQSKDLLTLLNHLKVPSATLVGCSSGGGHAIDFAIAHPEMVDRLILIGSVLHGMTVTAQFNERGNKNNAPLGKDDFKAAAENWSKDPFTITPGNEALRKRFYDALMQFPQNLKYAGDLEIRYMKPAVTRLSDIQSPTLILVGEFDIPDVHAFGGAIQAGIPGSRREVVKGAAHLIPLEKPEYLAERIGTFIEKYPRITVPGSLLESYVGEYNLWGKSALRLRNGRLFLQIPTEMELPLFPVSESKFKTFMWTQDAEIEFVKGEDGKISQLVITAEDGNVTKCPRL
jgi:pimeloyl-ACP methyl ester carboxylesterase